MAENKSVDTVKSELDQIRTLVRSANQSVRDQTITTIDKIENRFTKFADSCDVLIQSLADEMGDLGQSFMDAQKKLDKMDPSTLTQITKEAEKAQSALKEVGDQANNTGKGSASAEDGQSGGSGKSSVFNSIASGVGKAVGSVSDGIGKAIGSITSGAGKAIGSVTGGVGQAIGSLAGGIGKAVGGLGGLVGSVTSGIGGVASAVVDVAKKSLSLATDMSSAMGDFAIKTGVSKDSLGGYQEILENIYTAGYGESFADISDAMATVKQSFDGLSDEQLQTVTESALTLRDAFGYDMPEMTQAAKKLMDEFGVSSEEAFNMLAKGSQEGLLSSGDLISSIEASRDQFAGMAEDAEGTAAAMNGIKEVKFEDMGSMLEGMGRSLEMLLLPLGEALMPVLSALLEAAQPLLDVVLSILQPVLDLITAAINPLMEALSPLIELIGTYLTEAFSVASNIISSVFGGVIDFITGIIDRVRNIFSSIIDFVKNVFTGNWSGAWENVKSIFSNMWEGLTEVLKRPLNFIIDAINGLFSSINKVQIPDWVPVVGGKGFSLPQIPRLKVGLDYVPSDFYPAYLDRGERILTAEENARFTAAGGFAALQSGAGALMMFDPALLAAAVRMGLESASISVRGDVYTTLNADGKQLGQVVTPYVNQGLGALAFGKERGR